MDALKPSQYIRRHLTGGAHDLDDLVSRHDRDAAYRDVLERIHAINAELSPAGEPPLGIYTQAQARPALERLAEELEREGR